MKWFVLIVMILKIIFVVSALIKIISTFITYNGTQMSKNIMTKINTELRISRLLYYNVSLLLFFYWFNPFFGKICLKGEEKMLVFLFALIEAVEEILNYFFPKILKS